MYEQDILYGISKVSHKISYQYIERFYSEVKI